MDYWPQEVLLAFFKNLDPAQIGICAEVSKKWFQMSKDNEFWRQKCVEKWSLLPKEKDCKRNWLIPTKDGDEIIDWQRVYGLKKHWPDVIKCLEQYYDILDKSSKPSKGKKAQKTALKKLLDSVAKKDWIALAGFKQLALNAMECIQERELNMSDDMPLECVDSAIQFFLKMDLIMLSRSNATRVKQIGTGLQFMNIAHNIIHSKLKAMSVSLFWSFVQYTREYVQQLESKGLDYSSGIEAIFQLSTLYKNCTYTYAQIGLDLMPKVLDTLVYAINNWNIEVDLVFDQSNSIKKFFIVMQTLMSPYNSQDFSVVDMFINAFKSISPPKTPRESLTLAYFKNELQRGLYNLDEVKRLHEWYDSLPTPTGSTQDKTLILYHYENLGSVETARPDFVKSHHELKNIEAVILMCSVANLFINCGIQARPTEEPKINTACSFLLEAFLELDEKWQSKVMTKFLLHCKTYCWLLTKEQEDILFEKLKELGKESKEKDRAEKWIVQLAINCERISEYRELVISTITDPANSNLLGASAYSNTDLLKAAVEEYEREPRYAIETMLLRFGEEIEMIPTEKLPPNTFPILINVIGKRIALRRAQHNPNEDIEEDSDDSMDNEQYFLNEDQVRVDLQNEDNDENSQDDNKDEGDEHMDEKGIGLDIMEYSFDNSDDQDLPLEYGTRELVDLLMTLAARMNDDDGDTIFKKNLPNMLNIIKTEYNNLRIRQFFEDIAKHFLSDRTEGNLSLVADLIAESVVDWIHHTNLTHQNISQGLAKMLKTLVKTCSKNFLTADVVDKLLPWLTLEDDVYERSRVILWVVSVWGVLVNHAVDPTHPTNVLYQMLETMLKSDDGAHLPRVMQYLTGLLRDGVLQSSKFVPLLNMAWKLDYNVGALNAADSAYIKAEFIGAAAQFYPSIVQENLQDALNFFEDTLRSVDDAAGECSVPYLFLINLVEDPATWVHHMKIFLKVFLASGFDSERIAPSFPVLFKLVSPDHPHHKLLLEDTAAQTEIQRILSYIRDFEGENQPELYKYYGHFAEVCKKWFQMSKDNEFWRQKCVEKWSLLPKEKDCKRNWLIPTKEGDTLIDWQRVYAIKKHWSDVIKCLEQYYDLTTQKAQKTTIKKLLDRVVHKDWISLADFKQLATNAIKYISERPLYMDQGGNVTLLDIECVDSTIQFFLKMDLVMLSRSNASRVKQIGTGLQFINIVQRRNISVEKIRSSLMWSFIQYTHEYVRQLESKGLGYAAGLEVISEVSFLFEICMIQERREGLELIPKVIEILGNAINTWNIETYLVLRQSKSTQKMHFIMQALSLPIRVQKLSVVDVFVNAFNSISPPKTARESLTLAYFKNLLQTFLLAAEETKKLSEWYASLPTPTGSTQDKTLMLYHYENLTNLETVKPTEEPKKNAACSFLLEAFLDLDEKWQSKVMGKFLQHSKTYCWLLTNDQENVLFDKLKEISKQSIEARNQAEKWIVQLAINCERISEYKELVISTIMDPANSNLLGASVYSNGDLLQAAMEEYERDPRDYIETMLLKFGEEINMIPEGKLPPNIFSMLINIIGKRIALRRAQNNPNEDIAENGDIHWMDDDDDDEDLSDEDRDEDEHEDEDENSQDDDMDEDDENMDEKGISLEIIEDYFDDSSEQQDLPPIEYGTRELVDLLIRIASRMEDGETIKQNLPNMLDIIKTEYNNPKKLKFFIAIVGFFLSDRTAGNLALVADPIAASVVDWIHHTNLNDSNNTLDLVSKMLKTLVKTCSKNFLTADVVDLLLAWIDNGINTATEEMMSLWGVLANHAVDPTHPANLLYQRLETMLKSDDDAEKHQAIVYMTHLLHVDLFQNPKFVPLLKMVWKLSSYDLLEGTTAVIVRAVADFIGEMAQHRYLLVLENFQDILDVLEKTYKLKNLKSLSVSYALVLNLVEDPAAWIHHMKIFLETYKIYGSNSTYVDVISHKFPLLYKLLSPDHPHHKLLFEDPALRTRIEEILKEFKSSNIDEVLELCQYYGV